LAQYKTGTADFTNDDATVVGTDTEWTKNVIAGDIICRDGDSVVYTNASVDDDTHIELTSKYSGLSSSGAYYTISRDFSSFFGLYRPRKTDRNWQENLSFAIDRIDEHLQILYQSNSLMKTVVGKTGSYSLALTDTGKYITMNNTGATSFTLPYTTGGSIGAFYELLKLGEGSLTIQAQSGTYLDGVLAGSALCGETGITKANVILYDTNKWALEPLVGTWTIS
jgi:hypothetical protein